jgi:hypothetical protein
MYSWDSLHMPATTPSNWTFSPARAVLHAVIPVVVLVVVSVAIAVSMLDGAAVAKFGPAIGRFAVYLFAFGFGISYLAQTRRAWIAWVVGGASGAVMIWGVLTGGGQHTRLGTPAALRVPLVEGAGGRIRHPVLGFSFDKPAGFIESTAQNTSLSNETILYTYVNNESGAVLIAYIMYNVPRTRVEMQGMLDGTISGIVKQAVGQFPVTVTEKRVDWTEQAHQATAEAKLGEAQLSFRANVIEPENSPPVVVGLMGIGRQNDPWFSMTLTTWKPN